MDEQRRVHLSRAAPDAYKALDAFSRTVGRVAAEAGIEPRLREIVQLHVSARNGCAFCVRIHADRAAKIGIDLDLVAQIPVWRESGVFTQRERAALELAEAFTYIHEAGVPDAVYERALTTFSEQEYVALSWILVGINAFNRVAIAGRYPVPPRDEDTDS